MNQDNGIQSKLKNQCHHKIKQELVMINTNLNEKVLQLIIFIEKFKLAKITPKELQKRDVDKLSTTVEDARMTMSLFSTSLIQNKKLLNESIKYSTSPFRLFNLIY